MEEKIFPNKPDYLDNSSMPPRKQLLLHRSSNKVHRKASAGDALERWEDRKLQGTGWSLSTETGQSGTELSKLSRLDPRLNPRVLQVTKTTTLKQSKQKPQHQQS